VLGRLVSSFTSMQRLCIAASLYDVLETNPISGLNVPISICWVAYPELMLWISMGCRTIEYSHVRFPLHICCWWDLGVTTVVYWYVNSWHLIVNAYLVQNTTECARCLCTIHCVEMNNCELVWEVLNMIPCGNWKKSLWLDFSVFS